MSSVPQQLSVVTSATSITLSYRRNNRVRHVTFFRRHLLRARLIVRQSRLENRSVIVLRISRDTQMKRHIDGDKKKTEKKTGRTLKRQRDRDQDTSFKCTILAVYAANKATTSTD